MFVDYFIIGQGISGTWLSYYLLQAGNKVLVIDNGDIQSASQVASGLINPVTGRRVVTTWMADKVLPFTWNAYNAFSEEVHTVCISQKNILAFPLAPDLQDAFNRRMLEGNGYIYSSPIEKNTLREYFNFPFDVIQIAPCYAVDVRTFLKTWRDFLVSTDALVEERFDEERLSVHKEHILYKDISAKKIIYCNGIQTAESKFWKNLPFVSNKGQALIVDIPVLMRDHIYKFGHLTLIPWQENLWWAGSSNELKFDTLTPTEDFYIKTRTSLTSFLKTEFKIVEHISALRPATVERRPFVGCHPQYAPVVILNGMGSKGCSLTPWFAKELSQHLVENKNIDSLADVKRYENILKRQ